jgi:asparagine synthase (glutamine-hydrolysing)
MLFNAFKNSKYKNPVLQFSSNWYVAFGSVNSLVENVTWQDEHFSFISKDNKSNNTSDTKLMALSPKGQFVVVGEVWLNNRNELIERLGININKLIVSGFELNDMGMSDIQLTDIQLTDIQIVAQLWERWGCESLKLLVGMFALVVWDRERQELYLGRDRVGARTVYYTRDASTYWVAASSRSLRPYHSDELDLVALRDYLSCAFVPGERTLWKQVREVRPGTVLQLPDGKVNAYWELKEQIRDADKSLAWHGERLRELLDNIIQEYLPKNQPVGVFLSGGLDSSCITALASKFHNFPVHTFSIHFGSECPNELEFSSLVANHCQTQHHILEITFRDMWNRLLETMAYLDDPIGDPLTVPNLLVGELAKESVDIILNGEGGDPCFGGPKNQPMLINTLYGELTNQNLLQAYLNSFHKCAADLPQLLKPEIWQAVETEDSVFSDDLYSNANYLNRLMALNIKYKGADQILTKVSNLTQATGLIGLSPLFDQRIVDLSMQIPPEYKLSGVEEKASLKQAVFDILPEAIINRPKSGMMVPVQMGFRQYWHREARKLLLNKKALIAPYFNQSLINDWLNFQGDVWMRYGVKLWLLVSLEMWLQANKK